MQKTVQLASVILFILYSSGCINPLISNSIKDSGITAMENLDQVNQLAEKMDGDLKLSRIYSDTVNVSGTSVKWNYVYFSTSPPDGMYYFHATFTSVAYDSSSSIMLDGVGIIDNMGMDSNRALEKAEELGGSDFRKAHPNFRISASLSQPVVPDATTWWYIRYFDGDDIFHVQINACPVIMND